MHQALEHVADGRSLLREVVLDAGTDDEALVQPGVG
jgi:hypothetical protein